MILDPLAIDQLLSFINATTTASAVHCDCIV